MNRIRNILLIFFSHYRKQIDIWEKEMLAKGFDEFVRKKTISENKKSSRRSKNE